MREFNLPRVIPRLLPRRIQVPRAGVPCALTVQTVFGRASTHCTLRSVALTPSCAPSRKISSLLTTSCRLRRPTLLPKTKLPRSTSNLGIPQGARSPSRKRQINPSKNVKPTLIVFGERRESGSCVLPAQVTRALMSLGTNLASAIVPRRQVLPRVRLHHLLLPRSIIRRRTRAQTHDSTSNCSHSSPPARALQSTQLSRSALDLRRPSTDGPRPERPRTI